MSEQDSDELRILRIAYVTGLITASLLLLLAKGYVYWQDPWLTPRFTPYILLFWRVRDTLGPFLVPAVFIGVVRLLVSRSCRRRWSVWLAIFLAITAQYEALFP